MAKNVINCPACGQKDTWTEGNKHRPFCSERCKLIDLGDWASEQHRIAGTTVVLGDHGTNDGEMDDKNEKH